MSVVLVSASLPLVKLQLMQLAEPLLVFSVRLSDRVTPRDGSGLPDTVGSAARLSAGCCSATSGARSHAATTNAISTSLRMKDPPRGRRSANVGPEATWRCDAELRATRRA